MKRTLLTLALVAAPCLATPPQAFWNPTLVHPCDSNLVSPCYVDLTADQIRTVLDGAIEVLPAPGAGKALRLLSYTGAINPGSIPFAYDGHAVFKYSGDSQTIGTVAVQVGGEATDDTFITAFSSRTDWNLDVVTNVGISLVGNGEDPSGRILTSSINAAGTGYEANDTFTVDSNVGTQATGVVDTVGALGIVTSYHITNGTFGYLAGDTASTTATSGIGTGLTINILTITPANGTARVYIDFVVLPLP